MRALVLLVMVVLAGVDAVPAQRRQVRRLPDHYQQFASREDDDSLSRVSLRNGFRISVEEFGRLPLAAVVTRVELGREDAPLNGVPVLAQLWMLSDLPSRLYQIGGTFQVSVEPRATIFSSIVPAENVDRALELHSRLLGPLPWAGPELETRLQQVRSFSESGAGTAPESSRRLWKLASAESGEGWFDRITGSLSGPLPSTSELIELQKALSQPTRVVLAVSGQVLREDVFKKSVELFAPMKKLEGRSGAAPGKVGLGSGFVYQHVREDAPSAVIQAAFRVPGTVDKAYPAIQLLAEVLGGRGGLLQRHLVGPDLAFDAAVSLQAAEAGGLLEVTLKLKPGQTDAVEVGLLALGEALGKRSLGLTELKRAKMSLWTRHIEGLRRLDRRAALLAAAEAGGRFKTFADFSAEIAGATPAMLQEAAQKVFTTSNLILLERFPVSAELRSFESESLAETLELLRPPTTEKLLGELVLAEARRNGFEIGKFKPNPVRRGLKRTSVLRGPEIYLAEDFAVPLVELAVLFPGGQSDETDENSGLTRLSLELFLRELGEQGGKDFWRNLEAQGLRVEPIVEPDFFGLMISWPVDQTEDIVERILSWLNRSLESQDALAIEKLRMISLSIEGGGLPADRLGHMARLAVYEGSSLGRPGWGSPASLAGIDLSQINAWFERQSRPYHPLLVVRGAVEGTSFLNPLISLLSDSKRTHKKRPAFSGAEVKKPVVVVEGDGRVGVGFEAPERGRKDAWLLDIVQALVELEGTLPGFAVGQVQRIDHQVWGEGGLVWVSVPGEPANSQVIGARLADSLRGLFEGPIREQDFRQSQVLAITHFYAGFRGEDSFLELCRNAVFGEKPDYPEEYLTVIRSTQVEELRRLGQRVFRKLDTAAPTPSNEEP